MQQELLLGDLMQLGLLNYPSRNALVWGDETITYMGLNGLVDLVTTGLRELGVRRGDRVALYMHNIPQFVQTFYALTRLGAIAVPIDIQWKGNDLHHLLSSVGVSGIVTLSRLWSRVNEMAGALPDLRWAVTITDRGGQLPINTTDWDAMLGDVMAEPIALRGLEGRNPAMIAYSAGTSGPPKPALLSHFNLLANCEQFEDMEQVELYPALKRDPASGLELATQNYEVALLPLPLTNLFSLNMGLNLTLKLGGTAVLMERPDADEAIELIEEHKCTLVYGTPAFFKAMITSVRFGPGMFDLSSLRYAFSYGGPLPGNLVQAFYERTGKILHTVYGAVEASPVITCTAAGPKMVSGSVGYPLGVMQVVVADRQGNNVPVGQAGQLIAQGPNVMVGYYNQSDPSQPIQLDEAGWFNTDDVAYAGQDGNIFVLDRKEDIIPMQGRAVFPQQIEQVLAAYAGVKEVAALAADDGNGGQRVVAFIVPASVPPKMTEADLLRYCRQHLAESLCPQRIYLYEDGITLPRLPDGRIWRRALRTRAAQLPR